LHAWSSKACALRSGQGEKPVPQGSGDDHPVKGNPALDHRSIRVLEDRQILADARRKGISYFNTLMMLNFLLFVEAIDDRAYGRYLEKLKRIAWYGPEIWEFGKNI
jgi:hypothetical protein